MYIYPGYMAVCHTNWGAMAVFMVENDRILVTMNFLAYEHLKDVLKERGAYPTGHIREFIFENEVATPGVFLYVPYDGTMESARSTLYAFTKRLVEVRISMRMALRHLKAFVRQLLRGNMLVSMEYDEFQQENEP